MNDRLAHYVTQGYKKVDGWGVDSDLIEIFRLINDFQASANIRGPLCEIGVHQGRTLILLGLLANREEGVIGVDLFEDAQEQNIDLSGSGSYRILKNNIDIHAPDAEFDIVKANSFFLPDDVLARMNGARIFHIDGGHFFEVVLNDISIAQTVIGSGGIIVIDDYWHSGFPEVQEAVHHYFWNSSNIKAIPFAIGRNKIFLVDCVYKQKLLDLFRRSFKKDRQKTVKVLRHEAICIDLT